ncbi:hydrolethalus syndrome protein 1-like [Acanthaster planci]|uniref:Hydrolethalus syndrome protein 1-like n=1 Tax=Acanthaster planci TaxID=133434 RepID=A0A8B7ZR00_ACAPL|nr:hydrolethalus syndrome protein 1-like [Acanthaster planci]XP_022107493.1 hydrolethalus syndrome protein 1-like [Acanthaster planci]
MDTSDDSLRFSEDDVRRQLGMLGYHNIPTAQLQQFAKDLERLIKDESEREGLIDTSAASDLDYTAEDLRLPVRSHPMPYPSAGGRRPNSAPSAAKRSYKPVAAGQPVKPKPSQTANYPAKHPEPFSYKYGDTSTVGLDTTDDSTQGRGRQGRGASANKRPTMKRKVVRKMNGQAQVFDESITESESGDVRDVGDRLSRLALRQDVRGSDDEDGDTTLTETDSASSLSDLIYTSRRPHSSRGLYTHRPAGDENTVYKPHLPRSFIRPDSAQPRTKHDMKTDPVSRHQMYKAAWSSHRAPGEKNRNDLRWSIREQMMYKDSAAYPRRTPRAYSANNYVVPTDKKRQALRWAVRTSLAHRQMPPSTFY